jgi:radical SAM protein with 4Fe4S-binding SPASM domain
MVQINRKSFVLVPQHFGSMVFDRSTSRYMPFDHGATKLLRQAISVPFTQQISEQSDRDCQTELINFYESLSRKHFFDVNDRFHAEELELEPPSDHLAGPLALHLEIIGACNLTCKHCFAGALPRNQSPLLLSEMDSLFAELAAIGSFRLGLTGGEPLMRNDLFDILDSATDNGLHPCLTTNGLLIDRSTAIELGKRELVWLNVSLEGATAESNDTIRGEGVFDQVIERLRILSDHARFTLAFTLTSLNFDEADRCAELAQRVGASAAVFRPLYPVGVAADHDELMPKYRQYIDALSKLGSIEAGNDLHPIDAFSPQVREDSRSKVVTNNGCGAANLIASVSVQGDVNPCSFLGSGYDAGNLRNSSFREIWNQSEGFTGMRSWSKQSECGTCEKGEFAGGCRARAQYYNGHANAADPWHDEWKSGLVQLHPMSNWEMQRD